MPITTDLNIDPYFDDFNIEKQFYKVLFKPAFAVQSRELTQLQTILQNQIEQFGDNIFKEGSIIRGCNFTELSDLQYVKVKDRAATSTEPQFDPTQYIGQVDGNTEIRYELEGQSSGLRASIVSASRGFETRPPDLNTFYINYLNTNDSQIKQFIAGEELHINRIRIVDDVVQPVQSGDNPVTTINVTSLTEHVGNSFGLRVSEGVLFQKGHFVYTEEQLVILSKYNNAPSNVSVGYVIQENLISYLQDSSLLDNANGFSNENAPGADRLNLIPILTVKTTDLAEEDTEFFILSRYENGNAVQVRDVSQYNIIGQEMAKRTFEESGDYIIKDFKVRVVRRNDANNTITVAVSPGVAYVRGFRIENNAELFIDIDNVTSTNTVSNQPISFNYGGYISIDSVSGTVPYSDFSTVDLQDAGSSNIGTAIVKNITPDRLYLFNIQMNSNTAFSDVTKVAGTSGFITLANNTIIQEKSTSELIFDTGAFSLKDVTNVGLPVRDIKSLVNIDANTEQIVLTSAVGEDFDVANDVNNILIVDDSNTKLSIDSISVSPNKETLTIDLAPGQTPTANCTIYYNKRIQDADPYTKISRDVYIKNTFADGTTKYNLGFPDVYKIISITDANDVDVTDSFRLIANQRDNYYDHSYIELISGRQVPADGTLTIRMNVFQVNNTSGKAYFSISSYPVDVPSNEITNFTSTGGRVYNLRESLDFRPMVDPVAGADYNASSAASAPTIAPTINLTPSFSGTMLVPAINSTANADFEYYLARRDLLTADSYGKFAIVKGDETENPVLPAVDNKLVLSEIFIPGFPILSTDEAAIQNKPEYSLRLSSVSRTKAYRMSDINELEKKIDQIRYYVLLSHLEASTRNLNIVDDNGRSRFKNGIIVDSFSDLSVADSRNAEYNAAINFTEKSLTPAVRMFPLDLTFKSASNASTFPETGAVNVATLSRDTNVAIINQKYATTFRNCVSNFYKYRGSGFINPPYDVAYDTTTNPLTLNFDVFGPIQQLVDNIQEFIPLTQTSTRVLNSDVNETRETSRRTRTATTTTVIERELESITRSLSLTQGTVEERVGDFVTNVDFKPYIRSTELKIYMSGLRPNTRHYFFFDQRDVNSSVAPGTSTNILENIQRNGAFGSSVITDANGILTAVFFIPEETFYVGERKLEIVDVDQYESIGSASTSYGFVNYNAYNFDIEKAALTTSTRIPETTIETTSSTRTVTNRTVSVVPWDPVAQTFFIKSGMGQGSDAVYVSSVDLYFKRKSLINGVNVMIREVVNGVPSYDIVPFSKVHLQPVDVSVSNDSSAATTVAFPAPVRLEAEKEYAIVVNPDASDPDYLIFTSKVGENDLIDGLPVANDWGDGVLFTSTNNRAWQSYQDEDIKFTLYRHDFNSTSGSVTLTNNDHEFITIEDSIGKFKKGEFVYVEAPLTGLTANTVSVTAGDSAITGTNLSDTYAVGDFVVVDDGANKGLFRVSAVTGTTITADRPSTFTSSGSATPVVGGELLHYDVRNPNSLIVIEGSSATADKFIQAGDTLIGFDSEATANVASVDNIDVSYFQPMISRVNETNTRTTMSGEFTAADNVNQTFTKNINFNNACRFGTRGTVIYSKSNNLLGLRTFELTINMESPSSVASPFIDLETSKLFIYQFKSTNSSDTTSKYISKVVELAEGLDAEDFQIYVTAYRPGGSNVKVYFKGQQTYDPIAFESADWVELELTAGDGVFSSSTNYNDFREFEYKLPASSKDVDGVFTYTNADGAEFASYSRFAVKIELLSEDIFNVPRLLDYRGIALT